MNPELQKAISEEIAKSPQVMQDFLNAQYFKDTIKLIERVNKLDEKQAASMELEITMFLLGISDYADIEEAFRGELGVDGQVANEATVRQAVKDVDSYITSRAPKIDTPTKIDVVVEKELTKEENPENKDKNLHEILYNELAANKNTPLVVENTGVNTSSQAQNSVTQETTTTPATEIAKPEERPLDFYREKISVEDKTVKHL